MAAYALLISILLPMVGSILVACLGSRRAGIVRWMSLTIASVTLALAIFVVASFDTSGDEYMNEQLAAASGAVDPLAGFRAAETAFASIQYVWLPPRTGIDVQFAIGLDGISVWLYGLTAILMLSSILISWTAIEKQAAMYYGMLLLLEAGCLGVFAARDIILFYVFFEFTLIPLFFLIGIWGSEDRRYAANKFFLYTLAGSLLTFLGLLTVVLWVYSQMGTGVISCSIPELVIRLTRYPMPASLQMWVFVALFVGFAIKVPLFPLHTWLPLAHVQAPAAGSVFLAGILLKIGTYGFLRFSIPMLPEATLYFAPWILWLATLGIIYGALVALAQSDMKRLIAYSSVSHLGFCMLGLFALNPLGVQGATLQMLNHGISTGALFAIIGMLYERYHTREISEFGGLARRYPVLAFFMLLFTLSSIGLPGLNGFVGEIMILIGAFQRGWAQAEGPWMVHLRWISVLALTGVVLGAWYMLSLVRRVFFGQFVEPGTSSGDGAIEDLSRREVVALLPLAVLVFWIGVYPQFFLQRIQPGLHHAMEPAAILADKAEPKDTLVSQHPEGGSQRAY